MLFTVKIKIIEKRTIVCVYYVLCKLNNFISMIDFYTVDLYGSVILYSNVKNVQISILHSNMP